MYKNYTISNTGANKKSQREGLKIIAGNIAGTLVMTNSVTDLSDWQCGTDFLKLILQIITHPILLVFPGIKVLQNSLASRFVQFDIKMLFFNYKDNKVDMPHNESYILH